MLNLTYYKAPKGSDVFSGAQRIETPKATPGEIGRRKAQLAAVVETALNNEEGLLIISGAGPEGSFKLVAVGSEGAPETAPNAATVEELAETKAALIEKEDELLKREAAVQAASDELTREAKALTEREAELDKREAALKKAEAKSS